MNAVITVLGWFVLAIVSSMRFSVQPTLSATERARLVKQGDRHAKREDALLELAPLLQSLQFVVRTVLVSAFITFCVIAYGVVNGVILGTIAVLVLPLTFRLPFFCAWADRLRDIAMPWLEKAAWSLRPLLNWLRARDVVLVEQRLNSQTELLEIIKHSPGVLSSAETGRLVASLAFDARAVKDIMTPKSMIQAVKGSETLGPLVLDELYKTGFSRFPVYKNDIDHMIGMLYLHDLIDMKTSSKTAEQAMQRKVYYIHENHTLSRALRGFIKTHHHLFVVVNEYRETVGLLSLEDVIETLIGDTIVDEFDAFDDLRAVAEHNPRHNNTPQGKKDV